MIGEPSGFANYVQAVCRCRRGFMCAFCRKWLAPPAKQQRAAVVLAETCTGRRWPVRVNTLVAQTFKEHR